MYVLNVDKKNKITFQIEEKKGSTNTNTIKHLKYLEEKIHVQ